MNVALGIEVLECFGRFNSLIDSLGLLNVLAHDENASAAERLQAVESGANMLTRAREEIPKIRKVLARLRRENRACFDVVADAVRGAGYDIHEDPQALDVANACNVYVKRGEEILSTIRSAVGGSAGLNVAALSPPVLH